MKKSFMRVFKKGATLIELTIVLAIVSIMSVVIMSFASSVRNYSKSFNGTYNSYSDFDSVRLGFQKWLTHFDSATYGLTTSEDSGRLIAKKVDSPATTYSLAFLYEDNTFIGYYPENNDSEDYQTTVYYFGSTKTIVAVSFDIVTVSERDGCLVKCQVQYDSYNRAGTQEFVKTIDFFHNMYVAGRIS